MGNITVCPSSLGHSLQVNNSIDARGNVFKFTAIFVFNSQGNVSRADDFPDDPERSEK
jgi:hypothetical protein